MKEALKETRFVACSAKHLSYRDLLIVKF
jgi:hypothetical protein